MGTFSFEHLNIHNSQGLFGFFGEGVGQGEREGEGAGERVLHRLPHMWIPHGIKIESVIINSL